MLKQILLKFVWYSVIFCSFVWQRKDVKILRTVESFHSLINTLVTDQKERERFFKVSPSPPKSHFGSSNSGWFQSLFGWFINRNVTTNNSYSFYLTGRVSRGLWSKVWWGAGEAAVGVSDSTGPATSRSQPGSGREVVWEHLSVFCFKYHFIYCSFHYYFKTVSVLLLKVNLVQSMSHTSVVSLHVLVYSTCKLWKRNYLQLMW